MKKSILLILFSVVTLSACGGGASVADPPDGVGREQPNYQGGGTSNKAGAVIANEDLSPGLRGVDSNGNGIRDDIDRLIATKYSSTPTIRKVAEQNAKALQGSMEATTKLQTRLAGIQLMRAGRCSSEKLPKKTSAGKNYELEMIQDLTALTTNTKERFSAYWAAEALAGGMVFERPDRNYCD